MVTQEHVQVDTDVLDAMGRAAAEARGTEQLVPALLDVLAQATKVEATFVAEFEAGEATFRLGSIHHADATNLRDGHRYRWRHALDGPTLLTSAAQVPLPGMATLLSVPVRTSDGAVSAMLCAASAHSLHIDRGAVAVGEVAARLIADRVELEELAREVNELSQAMNQHATTATEDLRSSRLALRRAVLECRRRLKDADTKIRFLRERLAQALRNRNGNGNPSLPRRG